MPGLTAAAVLAYLEGFAKHYGLCDCIRFQTEVVHVSRQPDGWHVTSRSVSTDDTPAGASRVEVFDRVVAANGRCNTPYIPAIPGLHHFRGRQTHSAWYRYPSDFGDARRVLVVGNNSSGCDITRELCGGSIRQGPGCHPSPHEIQQRTVWQSYHDTAASPPTDYDPRDESSPAWCRRIQVVGPIEKVEQDGSLHLQGGEVLRDIDVLVWATGFMYSFPFFDQDEPPFAGAPLYKKDGHTRVAQDASAASVIHELDDWMLTYRPDPTLCFLGVPNRIVPFPFVQLQARYATTLTPGSSRMFGLDASRLCQGFVQTSPCQILHAGRRRRPSRARQHPTCQALLHWAMKLNLPTWTLCSSCSLPVMVFGACLYHNGGARYGKTARICADLNLDTDVAEKKLLFCAVASFWIVRLGRGQSGRRAIHMARSPGWHRSPRGAGTCGC